MGKFLGCIGWRLYDPHGFHEIFLFFSVSLDTRNLVKYHGACVCKPERRIWGKMGVSSHLLSHFHLPCLSFSHIRSGQEDNCVSLLSFVLIFAHTVS